MTLSFVLKLLLTLSVLGIAAYLLTARRYQSSDSVANSYESVDRRRHPRVLLG